MRVNAVLCPVAIAGALVLLRSAGADDCKGPSRDCVAVGRWNFSVALGAGAITNPVLEGKDIPLVVIPQFSYYGKRFFIDNLDLGFTVAEGSSNTLNLVASPGYDRVYFYRSDLQNIFVRGINGAATVVSADTPGAAPFPPRPRHVTYLAGPEWSFKYGGVTGQLDVLHEITGRNGGDEIRAAAAIPLVQVQGSLTANLGVTWKSTAIVNYYYGAPHVYYGAGSALDPFFKLAYTLPLSARWRFSALAEYEHLGNSIADSPIVAEHHVATIFVGAIHTF